MFQFICFVREAQWWCASKWSKVRTPEIHRPGSYYRPCYFRHQILTLKFRLTFIGIPSLRKNEVNCNSAYHTHTGVRAYSLLHVYLTF